MSIARYMVVALARCSCALALARAPVEFAEAEMAVGDEGAHASHGYVAVNLSSSVFASLRSAVSKPSVNQS